MKTGHISEAVYTQQAVEMLTALKKLGETVSSMKLFQSLILSILCLFYIGNY